MILAIDTATDTLGLALHDGRRIVFEMVHPARLRHTVSLAPAVEEMLAQAGARPEDVKGLGVAQGPGSYTALRIGLSFAAGFALPRNLPVAGVPTLDILAAAQPPSDGGLTAVLQAGRGRVAACRYAWRDGAWRAEGDPRARTWEELSAELNAGETLCGDLDRAGWAAMEKRRDVRIASAPANVRRPGVLADLAAVRLREARGPAAMPAPIYLPAARTEKDERGN